MLQRKKVGREIHDIPVYSEDEATFTKLGELEVQEIILQFHRWRQKRRKNYIITIKRQAIN